MQSRSPIFLIIVAILTGLSIWAYTANKYSYGLDVKGGVRLSYQIDPNSLTPEMKGRMESIQDDLVRIMTARAGTASGVVEPSVSKKGLDQVIVELPGYTDIEEAKKNFATSARITLYWAKNVSTPKRKALYEESGEETVNGVPFVKFTRVSKPDEVLKPGDKGYADMISRWEKIVEGGEITNAYPHQLTATQVVPEFTFSSEGEQKMQKFSRQHNSTEEKIAFVLDGKVLNIAHIQEGQILGSEPVYVNGQFEPKYVRSLTDLIKAGALPVDLIELSSEKVDPTIGAKALDQIVFAGIVSFGIVCAFLIIYYSFPGIIAALAMCLYALFTITILKMLGATFSLAAIAGFILSVSMAVDANILIFERLKEEIRAGRTLTTAIDLAFKRALSAIFDSNASTILTSLVLFFLGTGAVKGFATTLIIGVAISFFTAVTVTRFIINGLVSIGVGTNMKWYGLNRNWFGENIEQKANEHPWPVVQKSGLYFGISGAIMVIGLIFVFIGGIKPNVEFQGGFEFIYVMKPGESKTSGDIIKSLNEKGIKKANVKFGTGQDKSGAAVPLAYITVPHNEGIEKNDKEASKKVADAAGLSMDNSSFSEIGPTVQKETVNNAIWGVVYSAGLIILLLAIRFGTGVGGVKNGVKFGISAAIAMLHDVVVVIGTAGVVGFLLGWEISALFITAMLTVASFSVHDTVVIFDRIRENLKRPHKGETFEHLCNRSITQSFARSLNTSMTAIVTLIILIAVGTPTPELKFMCVAMLTGIVIGTYSSIFNATPILYLWDKAVIKMKGEEAGLMLEAENHVKMVQMMQAQSAPAGGTPGAPADAGNASAYGQVRRKRAADKATKPLDDE